MNLETSIDKILQRPILEERKEVLQPLVAYIQARKSKGEELVLSFICTHNSRRSQFAQLWATVAAHAFGIRVRCLSGGVEVTEFNLRAVASLERFGFLVSKGRGRNPKYEVRYALKVEPLIMFSKLYNHDTNRADKFAAVMTCSDADANCPFIPGTEQRISLNYDDPKEFDDTPKEAQMYDERSMQIASEMFYVFSKQL